MTCFASWSQYSAWSQQSASVATSTCATNLVLYENLNYGGRALILAASSSVYNLSNYNFDNIVSSFKVGSCAANFFDGPSKTGNQYPGVTSPGTATSWIGSTWNDRIVSVYEPPVA